MDIRDIERLKRALPRYPDIMGRNKLFNAAVLIPLLREGEEYYFLFEKRPPHIRQGGEISFPGGEFDPDKDVSCLMAALRETEEEIGISPSEINVIGRLDTFVSPRGMVIETFLGEIEGKKSSELKPDKNEVEELFTLPVSWFEKNPPQCYQVHVEMKPYYINEKGERIHTLPVADLGLPPRYEDPWPSISYDVFVYQTPLAVIWGITARLIVEMISQYLPGYP